MCGILGWCGTPSIRPTPKDFEAALDLLHHRGPDGGNYWFDRMVCLGHARLSIVGLEAASNQPFFYENLVLTFNGEIYNYSELKKQLNQFGYNFETSSDTEVLIKAWHLWGAEALSRLEGMFSFAIWNKHTETMTVARDRFGEKPLFYLNSEEKLIFSSELPSIIRIERGGLREDREQLGRYFRYTYIPAPFTIFEDVHQLLPGHFMSWKLGCETKIFKYFSLKDPEKKQRDKCYSDFHGAKIQLKKLLKKSVSQRVFSSDVPISTFLSGGVDSSIITTIVSKLYDCRFPAYSLGFPNEPKFNETDFATEVASRLANVDHIIVNTSESQILDALEDVVRKLGEPFADASLLPSALLSANVSEKVALGGDGADELFAGYGVYPAILAQSKLPYHLRRLMTKFPNYPKPNYINNKMLRKLVLFYNNIGVDNVEGYLAWRSYTSQPIFQKLGLDPLFCADKNKYFGNETLLSLKDIMRMDIEFNLHNDMLKKIDYASMMSGLEVRSPFLDSELTLFSQTLPEHFLITDGQRKFILKKAYEDCVPKNILNRGKQGFLLPIREWFKNGRLQEKLQERLSYQKVLKSSVVEEVLSLHKKSKIDASEFLWATYVYLEWSAMKVHWSNHSSIRQYRRVWP